MPEQPHTIVLLEDTTVGAASSDNFGRSNNGDGIDLTTPLGAALPSWRNVFRSRLPEKHGFQFCYVSLSADTHGNDDNNVASGLREDVDELQNDLQQFPSVVIIAKGPYVTSVAQYYLESHSVSGMVLVDPIQLPPTNDFLRWKEQLQKHGQEDCMGKTISSTIASKLLAIERPLLLEAGVVPMMVLQTPSSDGTVRHRYAEDVAARHSDPMLGMEVPIGRADTPEGSLDSIVEWIDEVL